MKIEAQIYPAANQNLDKSFKPLTLGTRQLNAAYQKSDLISKADLSDHAHQTFKTSSDTNPYQEAGLNFQAHIEATAKTLNPV